MGLNGGAMAPQSEAKFGVTRKWPRKIRRGDSKSSLWERRLPLGVRTIVTPNRPLNLPLKIFRGKKHVPLCPLGVRELPSSNLRHSNVFSQGLDALS